jgi:hypothetical protein
VEPLDLEPLDVVPQHLVELDRMVICEERATWGGK